MSLSEFGTLAAVPLREAWSHEARSFTPWLAANLDRLGQVLGIPLELEGQEVRVGAFAADLLARNREDGSLVLIENQLEQTDHNHLGQILTYLVSLEAQCVVWIASEFREPISRPSIGSTSTRSNHSHSLVFKSKPCGSVTRQSRHCLRCWPDPTVGTARFSSNFVAAAS